MYTPMGMMPKISPWEMAPGSALMKTDIGFYPPIDAQGLDPAKFVTVQQETAEKGMSHFRCFSFRGLCGETYSAVMASYPSGTVRPRASQAAVLYFLVN